MEIFCKLHLLEKDEQLLSTKIKGKALLFLEFPAKQTSAATFSVLAQFFILDSKPVDNLCEFPAKSHLLITGSLIHILADLWIKMTENSHAFNLERIQSTARATGRASDKVN